ncbi:MAG: GNAT family N-acetyltransferase [Oscillospiraceae bacterium]|nr:GNAT family N-acetyltransferase [Oscillospiraceae bacterium]
MTLTVKRFDELTLEELYEILRLRMAVFVVEQACAYQDIDDKDQAAVHAWLSDDDGIAAYLRVMDRGVYDEEVAIGRVISLRRRQGLATQLMREGVRIAREVFGADVISVEAQVYARGLYEKLGFRQASEEFLEDGIPHIRMLLRF